MSTRRVLQRLILAGTAAACFAASTTKADASDWARFRGPNGTGVSTDADPLPTTFSETENLKWKVEIPGAGVSCPIVVGDRVFVTCYSGYGIDRQNPGEMKDLKRHLVCIERATGKTLWDQSFDAVLPEDEFSGMGVPEHGYASHTPVSDGRNVYVFYGKSGVLAYDFDGNELWKTSVGTGSSRMEWGSSSSPILHENLLVVPAGAEARAVIVLEVRRVVVCQHRAAQLGVLVAQDSEAGDAGVFQTAKIEFLVSVTQQYAGGGANAAAVREYDHASVWVAAN